MALANVDILELKLQFSGFFSHKNWYLWKPIVYDIFSIIYIANGLLILSMPLPTASVIHSSWFVQVSFHVIKHLGNKRYRNPNQLQR